MSGQKEILDKEILCARFKLNIINTTKSSKFFKYYNFSLITTQWKKFKHNCNFEKIYLLISCIDDWCCLPLRHQTHCKNNIYGLCGLSFHTCAQLWQIIIYRQASDLTWAVLWTVSTARRCNGWHLLSSETSDNPVMIWSGSDDALIPHFAQCLTMHRLAIMLHQAKLLISIVLTLFLSLTSISLSLQQKNFGRKTLKHFLSNPVNTQEHTIIVYAHVYMPCRMLSLVFFGSQSI